MVRRAVDRHQKFGATLEQPVDRSVGHPEVLADGHTDADAADPVQLLRLGSGPEVSGLVEHAVVGELALVVHAGHGAVAADSDGVVDAAVRPGVGESEHQGAPAALGGQRLHGGTAVGHEPLLEHEVLERVAGEHHLRENRHVTAGDLAQGGADARHVAVEISDDAVHLDQRDPQTVHGGSVPTGSPGSRARTRNPGP